MDRARPDRSGWSVWVALLGRLLYPCRQVRTALIRLCPPTTNALRALGISRSNRLSSNIVGHPQLRTPAHVVVLGWLPLAVLQIYFV
jgi:hypothetical protein